MNGLLESKVAVITGAGSGVGRAACRVFAQHGAKVVAADINGEAAEATAAQVRDAGGQAIGQACDVADPAAMEAVVAAAVAEFGRLDVMYNNAAITILPEPGKGLTSFVDTDPARIARVHQVNVFGVMNGCRAAIRQFKKQGGGGAIVSTASVAGLIGYGGVAYGASKGAVTQLTKTLALEVAPDNIRVNSVCPAGMPTNYMPGADSDRGRASMAAAHPLGRPIEPEECANGALFLASDLASNITGVNLPIDGGLSAGVWQRR